MTAHRRMGSCLRWFFAGTTFLVAAWLPVTTAAAPPSRTDFPCKGCLFVPPPEGASKAPLLVVLHGDAPGGKKPLVQRDSAPFVAAAVNRGIAVLAPMCPKEEGCRVGSFWQWSQADPPAWIASQIDAVRKESSIDPDRIWIAGWSGGASFLGYHYPRLGERYAAVIFAGGGMPPVSPTCAPCSPPAYFLVGDKNPLHHLAKDLKTSVLACTNDVTWDLLPRKDHAGEWRALNDPRKVSELLDWLDKHPRNCSGTVDKPVLATSPPPNAPTASSSAPTIAETTPASTASPSARQPPSETYGSCTTARLHAMQYDTWWFVLVLFVGITATERPRRRHSKSSQSHTAIHASRPCETSAWDVEAPDQSRVDD